MAKKTYTIVREHPALFLGEMRQDLERVHAEDNEGNRVDLKVIDPDAIEPEEAEQIVGEILTNYPHNLQFEIVEE